MNKDWRSKWFASRKDYAKYLKDDLEVRKLIKDKLGKRAAINKVDIERSPNLITVTLQTAKAGVVIGRGGAGVQELKTAIEKVYQTPTRLNIEEVKSQSFTQSWSAKTSPTRLNDVFHSAVRLNKPVPMPCVLALKAFVSRLLVVLMALKCLVAKSSRKCAAAYHSCRY